jgi:predicted ATP-binding protein involved in virulence
MAQVFEPTATWPLLAWYGPQRRWTRGKDQLTLPLARPARKEAYEGCLATGGSEAELHHWFHVQTLADLQARQEGRPIPGWEAQVREAMRQAAPGVTGLRYDLRRRELRIAFDGGREVGWSQLSDGYHAFLGLVGDIGRRAAMLNDHLGEAAVREVEGLVLIDEIDLHLHPRWQLSVLDGLRRAFPRLQLVVTSHSTLLLSSVENRQVRELKDLQIVRRTHHVSGRDANALLREELQAQVRHPRGQDWLDQVASHIDAGDRGSAIELIDKLRERWGPTDAELAYYEALLSLDGP